MGEYGEPVRPVGYAPEPFAIIAALRWLGELTPVEIVEAIQAGGEDPDLASHWRELSTAEIEDMREQARAMTKSRLRAWKSGGERQPTWAEVRTLISGLHRTMG